MEVKSKTGQGKTYVVTKTLDLIPEDQKILNYYRQHGFKLEKRAERLGQLRNTLRTSQYAGIGPDRYHRRAHRQRFTAPISNHSPIGGNLGSAHRAPFTLVLQKAVTAFRIQDLQGQHPPHQQGEQRAKHTDDHIKAPLGDRLLLRTLHWGTTLNFARSGARIFRSPRATVSTR